MATTNGLVSKDIQTAVGLSKLRNLLSKDKSLSGFYFRKALKDE